MKGKKRNNAVGKIGRSGRKTVSKEKEFWKRLDAAIPEAVDFCVEVIKDTRFNLLRKDIGITERNQLYNIGLKASQILISKAPQRVANPDGSNLIPTLADKQLTDRLLDNII